MTPEPYTGDRDADPDDGTVTHDPPLRAYIGLALTVGILTGAGIILPESSSASVVCGTGAITTGISMYWIHQHYHVDQRFDQQ